MKKRIGTILVCMLLIVSSLVIVFPVGALNASSNILYVGGSGSGNYTRIQDAINDSVEGDLVFVYKGDYKEHLVINKGIKLIGEKKESTIINGEHMQTVIIITADNVLVSNFRISGSGNDGSTFYNVDSGIRIQSNKVNISHNVFDDNYISILVYNVSNNIFYDNYVGSLCGGIYSLNTTNTTKSNNIFNCSNAGIVSGETRFDIIKNNVFDNVSFAAIGLGNCSYAEVVNNNITGHSGFGMLIEKSFQNLFCNNSISIESSTMDVYQPFRFEKSHNNTVKGNIVYNSRHDGMLFFSSSNDNIVIENKLINNRDDGLVIAYSSGNYFESNDIINNAGDSIFIYGGSSYNSIVNNYISGHEEPSSYLCSGIKIEGVSSNNKIISNFILNHNYHGIDLWSNNNTIKCNTIENNRYDGIHFHSSNDNFISKNILTKNNNGLYFEYVSCNNKISENSITQNIDHGIYLKSLSEKNSIISNNFIGNDKNAFFETKGNVWRRNYWDRPRIIPYRIPGLDEQYEIDWFSRLFPKVIITVLCAG